VTTMSSAWPIHWRIAAAIARESGLDWARWAYGLTREFHESLWHVPPTPVPDPSDAEAYRADCARRGVEPGPMPALAWTGPDGLGWSVASYDGRVRFAHDAVDVAVWHSSDDAIEWLARPGYAALSVDVPREVVARLSALATAAARAMGVGQTLCGLTPSWDTRIPVTASTCRGCSTKRARRTRR
jgi:hypothetical protein